MVNDGIYTSEAPGYTPTLVSIDDVECSRSIRIRFSRNNRFSHTQMGEHASACLFKKRMKEAL